MARGRPRIDGVVEPDAAATPLDHVGRRRVGSVRCGEPRYTFVINGLSWPAAERLTYERGERVKWRVINLSSQAHPLHLHGFYFDVDSLGDGLRDSVFDTAHRLRAVTQLLPSGGTLSMTWTPERSGNWLFHCHIMNHVAPERRLGAATARGDHTIGHHAGHDAPADASIGMAGMVLGVTFREPRASGASARDDKSAAPRTLTLAIERAPGGVGELPAAGFVLSEGDSVAAAAAPVAPGPPVVLRRDQPVEITVVNRTGLGRLERCTSPAIRVEGRGTSSRAPDQHHAGRHLHRDAADDRGAVVVDAGCQGGRAGPTVQTIAVGETYEFEFQAPEGRRGAWVEVRTTGGKWQAQGRVVIK